MAPAGVLIALVSASDGARENPVQPHSALTLTETAQRRPQVTHAANLFQYAGATSQSRRGFPQHLRVLELLSGTSAASATSSGSEIAIFASLGCSPTQRWEGGAPPRPSTDTQGPAGEHPRSASSSLDRTPQGGHSLGQGEDQGPPVGQPPPTDGPHGAPCDNAPRTATLKANTASTKARPGHGRGDAFSPGDLVNSFSAYRCAAEVVFWAETVAPIASVQIITDRTTVPATTRKQQAIRKATSRLTTISAERVSRVSFSRFFEDQSTHLYPVCRLFLQNP